MVVYKTSYSKNISPPPAKYRNKSDILLSVDIDRILSIVEITELFEIKFRLYLSWKDPRLVYRNLKKNENLNVLRGEAQNELWAPELIFRNTKDSDRSKIDGESLIKALANKNDLFKKSDKSEVQNVLGDERGLV